MATPLASMSTAARLRRPVATALAQNLRRGVVGRSAPPAPASGGAERLLHAEGGSSGLLDDRGYLKFSTLHEMITNATHAYSDSPLFGTFTPKAGPKGEGAFQWMPYSHFGKNVATARSVLKSLGVQPGSKVGIISSNRHEWATLAAAAYSLNAALVPMYEAQLPRDWAHILNDSGCGTLFCSTEEIYLRAKKEVLPNCPLVREALCLDAPAGEPHSFPGAMARAERERYGGGDTGVVEPSAEDLANLIYTR